MGITVGDLRDLIDDLTDDTEVGIIELMANSASELAYACLKGAERGEDGRPRIVVEIGEYDEDEGDDLDDESAGSCERCGCDLWGDEASSGYCDQCDWETDGSAD